MNDRILLFIPSYNCEKQIIRVLETLTAEVMEYVAEVIIINNRSTDQTENVVQDFAQAHPELPLTLLRNNENYGLGGSHKVAFSYAIDNEFDYVIVLHGDDQGSILDLLPVFKSGAYRNYDCCLGARFQRDSRLQGYSHFRTFGNHVYNGLFSLALGRRIYDLGSGLNLYRVSMLTSGFYKKFPDNLTFNYCMILGLDYFRQKALFFPISWREEDQVSNVKMASQAFKVLRMLLQYVMNKQEFMKQEHRETIHEEYQAQAVHANSKAVISP